MLEIVLLMYYLGDVKIQLRISNDEKKYILPTHIIIHVERLPVKPKVKSVIQCRNRFRYDPTHRCRGKALCSECGQNPPPMPCPNELKCINCKSNHSSLDLKCPYRQFRRKTEVSRFGISYQEAIKKISMNYPNIISIITKQHNQCHKQYYR